MPKRPIRQLLAAAAMSFAVGVILPARATTLDLGTATIADINAAFAKGTLTSEKLVSLYLERIALYDKQGPTINSVITLNPKALEEARALDAERKAGKTRSPMHGIPVLLKDNFDTFDLPTTAGSQLLEGSIAPDDGFVVKRLREAGAIMLAKVNLSEFAGGGGSVSGARDPEVLKAGAIPNGFSSAGGQTRNPHDLARGPAGSSGGTGAALAAIFGQVGLGTDTGGSVRGPCAANGVAGLKPTLGLMSRDGIVPLALSFDTGGPMARSVYDVAASLSVMTGVDPADPATAASRGKFEKDYTRFLRKGSLKGARIGVNRDFLGRDPETDRIFEESIATLKSLGAEIIDPVKYPDYLLNGRQGVSSLVMASEFKAQIEDYLKTTKAGYPKTLADLVARANDPKTNYRSPEKAYALKYTASVALDLTDPVFVAARDQGLALTKATVDGLFAKHRLDAMVYPTSPRPAALIQRNTPAPTGDSPTNIANQTGYPDLIVPAGLTKDGLPVALSFFGPAFSEAKLFGYGYDFEQATKARATPKSTPLRPGDVIQL